MMKVSREFAFEASHILPKHPGKCARLHGHSWRLLVEVWNAVDKETGFVIDFAELKARVQPIVDRFDHQHLNCFVLYPSSEYIAIHIAHELRAKIDCLRMSVSVSETKNTWATWDSRSKYCQNIFSQNSLDSAEDQLDAGWRSPEFSHILRDSSEVSLKEAARDMFEAWEAYQTEIVQRALYMESLGKPGAIFEELKAVTQENAK